MTHSLYGRNLLSLFDLSDAELHDLLESAAELKQRQQRRIPHRVLDGYSLAMIFEKPSTRTRVGFEVAMTQLGGHAVYLSPRDTQLGRGETVADTARVLSRMCDGIMARVFEHSTLEELAAVSTVPVINGLSDLLHPVQALADLLTMREHFGSLKGLTVAYVGDSNNISNSWLEAAPRFGVNFRLGTPASCGVERAVLQPALEAAQRAGTTITITDDPYAAVAGADVLYTDVWTSMGQQEDPAHLAALAPFQINAALVAAAAPSAQVMHCLPMHRGEEISAEIAEGSNNLIFDQAENRLHMHKAILAALLGGVALTRSVRRAA